MRVSYIIVAALCVAIASAASEATPEPTTEINDVTTAKPTSEAPPTEPPTTTTTTVAPTTSEAPPTSSTTEPSTTTETSSTTEASTTTSTPSPDPSSTTPAPSTTPPPSPQPTWVVKNANGAICMIMEAKLTIHGNNTNYEVPKDASSDESKCDSSSVDFMLKWSDKDQVMDLQLHIIITDHDYYVQNITVKTPQVAAEKDGLEQFRVANGQYYTCKPVSSVQIADGISMDFADMKFEVFQNGTSEAKFSDGYVECSAGSHNNVVVVAVGCAMGVLIIVILVTYLVARRRNRQRGYQSV